MSEVITDEMRAKAEVCNGDETCREKLRLLLEEKGLPSGLLSFQGIIIEECGYVKDTGFVWLTRSHLHHQITKSNSKSKSKWERERKLFKFEDVVLSYDSVITAYFHPNKIKNLTGVKAKEFMIWVPLTEIYVQQSSSSSSSSSSSTNNIITFKTPVGLSRSFPVSMFKVETQTLEFMFHHDDKKKKKTVKKEAEQVTVAVAVAVAVQENNKLYLRA